MWENLSCVTIHTETKIFGRDKLKLHYVFLTVFSPIKFMNVKSGMETPFKVSNLKVEESILATLTKMRLKIALDYYAFMQRCERNFSMG